MLAHVMISSDLVHAPGELSSSKQPLLAGHDPIGLVPSTDDLDDPNNIFKDLATDG